MFKNKVLFKNLIIVSATAILIIFSFITWYNADIWANKVQKNDLWYKEPTVSRMERDFAYEQAFRKIVLFSGFSFSLIGLYLLFKNKNNV